MSNAETPAGTNGGNTATPSTERLADIPPRIRVHALAKLLDVTSKRVLEVLAEFGESTRSAQSSVSRDVAHKVGEVLGGDAGDTAATETAAESGQTTPGQSVAPPALSAAEPATATEEPAGRPLAPLFAPPTPMFLPPEPKAAKPAKATKAAKTQAPEESAADEATDSAESADGTGPDADGDDEGGPRRRRRRGRRGRGRGKGSEDSDGSDQSDDSDTDSTDSADTSDDSESQSEKSGAEGQQDGDEGEDSASRRRRRRRRRRGGGDGDSGPAAEDPPNTVVHVRDGGRAETSSSSSDQVRSVRGSTRLEAKRQRRRDGREAGRRRAPILSEAEFLARRESVERTMVVKENSARSDRTTQIGVLEDGVLVEHFVTSSGSGSIVGNVYLGRVQNVLPSMEAAFVDIGRGRNAVLYAGEVDWDAAGLEGKSRKIEQALSTGDYVLVQVTKDPVGHKGARLTTQISLPGRFLVYVPGGSATGISRKLPENERRRLKDILKRIVPDDAGVIIRTASEGISETELERDVNRLKAQWDTIKEKSDKAGKGKKGSPTLLYEEPDLLVKVVRDLFTEDFAKLVVQGSVAWETIDSYVQHVAPELSGRLERYVGGGASSDVFSDFRIDEQITKALDRKVWLPSGGYLVIDRTEAMTVIDVNTGKFTGSGGNLEETVTRNNLESAEEIVRQLRLRDIGGIIVIDFIDMVLESNRDLVLRRLTECLGRDRTRHQVAEVTSLGLVQMTRKRVGTGLLEAYSSNCEHCKGRGVVISTEPQTGGSDSGGGGGQQQSRKRGKGRSEEVPVVPELKPEQRSTVVNAVQAMANASKAVSSKPGKDGETEPHEAPSDAEVAPSAPEPVQEPAKPAVEVSAPKRSRRATRPPAPPAPEPVGAAEAAVATSEPAQATIATPEPAVATPVPQSETNGHQPSTTTASGVATAPAGTGSEVRAPEVRTVRRRRRAVSRPAGPPVGEGSAEEP